MLTRNGKLLDSGGRLLQKRTVFIPRTSPKFRIKETRQSEKRSNLNSYTRYSININLPPNDILNIGDPKGLELKVKRLQNFTKDLKRQLNQSKEHSDGILDSIDHGDIEEDADTIFQALNNDNNKKKQNIYNNPKQSNLISSGNKTELNLTQLISKVKADQVIELVPKEVRNLINDDDLIIQSLSNRSRQDWNPIIKALHLTGKEIRKLPRKDFNKFLLLNVHNLTLENVNKLDELFKIYVYNKLNEFTFPMYDLLFNNISKISLESIQANITTNDMTSENYLFNYLQDLVQRYDLFVKKHSKKNSQNVIEIQRQHNIILNYCITATSRTQNITMVDWFLKHFKEKYDTLPDKFTYTNIIKFYSRLNIIEKAWDTFDTMKFLSTSHSPDCKVYNQMLKLCQRSKNYSKAIDLFHEMKDKRVTPTVETFSIMGTLLAKCSSDNISAEGNDEALRLLGWKFIQDMINEDDFHSVGAMMALSSYDGDIGLSRAIYFQYVMKQYRKFKKNEGILDQIAWQRAMNPILFNYLLLSYSKWSPERRPLLMNWEEGLRLRRDLINSVDYTMRSFEDCSVILPFLPLLELNDVNQIIMESNALWHFHINSGQVNKDYLNPCDEDTNRIVGLISGKSDPLKNFLQLTTQLKSANGINSRILNYKCLNTYLTIAIRLNAKEEYERRLNLYTIDESELNAIEKFEPASVSSLQYKLIKNDSIYCNSMKAAIRFRDGTLSQTTWTQRGAYRRSSSIFKILPMKERINHDTAFAQLMVNYAVEMGQYIDALSIIMSSQRYINWQYGMVKFLHERLVELDDKKCIDKLLAVINKKDPIRDLDLQIKELSI